jgi:hypothetical protein
MTKGMEMAGRKTLATREVNGKTIRFVETQPVGEYDVKVISFTPDPDSERCAEAVYEISKDGKAIAKLDYFRPNFYLPGGVLTGPHFRVFSDAVYAAVEAASAKPRRQPRKPASKGAE